MRNRTAGATVVATFLWSSFAAAGASARVDDLFSPNDVAWHVRALARTPQDAERIRAAAGRANEDAAAVRDMDAALMAWIEAQRAGRGTAGEVSVIGALTNPVAVDPIRAHWAVRHVLRETGDAYFAHLAAELSQPGEAVASLADAHAVARWVRPDSGARGPVLRELARAVLGTDELPPPILAALREHERRLAMILAEWDDAERERPAAQARAWKSLDVVAFVEAQARVYRARAEQYREIVRGAEAVAALLPGKAAVEFRTAFRRLQYPPLLRELGPRVDALASRANLSDAARQAVEAFFERHHAMLDASMADRIASAENVLQVDRWVRSAEREARRLLLGETPEGPDDPITTPMDELRHRIMMAESDVAAALEQLIAEHTIALADPNQRAERPMYGYAADLPPMSDARWRFHAYTPIIGRPDFHRLLDRAEATSDERQLARSLYDDYRVRVDELAARLADDVRAIDARREAFLRANPDQAASGGWQTFNAEYGEVDVAWARQLQELDRSLWDDLRAVFGPARAPAFDRALLDHHWDIALRLRDSQMQGDGTQPRHLISQAQAAGIDPAANTEAAAILKQYRDELERILPAMPLTNREIALEMWRAQKQFQGEPQKLGPAISRERERWVAMLSAPHSMTDRARTQLQAVLTDDQRARLEEQVLRDRHPSLFVTSPIELLRGELAAAKSPSPDRLAPLLDMLDRADGLERANTEALIRARDHWADPSRRAELMKWHADNPPPDPAMPHIDRRGPMDDLWDERRNIVVRALGEVRRSLTPDELAALPPGAKVLLQWVE